MIDLALYVLLGLVIIVLSVWGGIVSAKSLPAGENKLVHIGGFIGCGVVAFVLTLLVGLRSYYAGKEAAKQQRELTESLSDSSKKLSNANDLLQQTRFSQEYMKGPAKWAESPYEQV